MTEADLAKPKDMAQFTAEDLVQELVSDSNIYQNYSDPNSDSGTGSASWTMQQECLKKADPKVRASASSFSIDFDLDIRSCLSANRMGEVQVSQHSGDGASYVPNSFRITSFRFRMAGFVSCTPKGADNFSGLNGLNPWTDDKPFSRIVEKVQCSGEEVSWGNIQISGSFSYDYILDGETRTYTWNNQFSSVEAGESFGKPCVTTWSGAAGTASACRYTDLRQTERSDGLKGASNIPTEPWTGYSDIRFNNLPKEHGSDSPWYASGTHKLTFNDWVGTITYRGVTTAPTINMSNGSETVNQALPWVAGARLVGEVSRPRSSFLRVLTRALSVPHQARRN